MGVRKISDWLDKKGQTIQRDEFFLDESQFAHLYYEANERYKKGQEGQIGGKKFPKPIIQLSPKGLSLLSYCYAQKDNNTNQPVVASTLDDLSHIAQLMEKAPSGISLTVIFQPTDTASYIPFSLAFSSAHKTVIKFQKTDSGLDIIHMDGTNNSNYGALCQMLINQSLKTNCHYYFQENLKKPSSSDTFSRQVDEYQCGIFATKDARQLNRDTEFLKKVALKEIHGWKDKVLEDAHYYVMPAEYLKNIQSETHFGEVLKAHGNDVVNRKGKTLKEVHEKHKVSGYVQHFSEKFRDVVDNFIKSHQNNPAFIRSATEQYDAGKLTMEDLIQRYGPKQKNVATASTNTATATKSSSDALNPASEQSTQKPVTFTPQSKTILEETKNIKAQESPGKKADKPKSGL